VRYAGAGINLLTNHSHANAPYTIGDLTDARMTSDAASGGRRNSPIAGLINRLRPFKTLSQSGFEGLCRCWRFDEERRI